MRDLLDLIGLGCLGLVLFGLASHLLSSDSDDICHQPGVDAYPLCEILSR